MFTSKEKQLIVDNVIKACSDITKLNKRSYNFLYLTSGFIAHYNIDGFKDYYEYNSLEEDILKNQRFNQYSNFMPDHIDYNYYMDKKDIYNRIVSKLHNQALNLMNT
jgi:hypothetical protein